MTKLPFIQNNQQFCSSTNVYRKRNSIEMKMSKCYVAPKSSLDDVLSSGCKPGTVPSFKGVVIWRGQSLNQHESSDMSASAQSHIITTCISSSTRLSQCTLLGLGFGSRLTDVVRGWGVLLRGERFGWGVRGVVEGYDSFGWWVRDLVEVWGVWLRATTALVDEWELDLVEVWGMRGDVFHTEVCTCIQYIVV